jgi:outer membrane protein assembly factor BamB
MSRVRKTSRGLGGALLIVAVVGLSGCAGFGEKISTGFGLFGEDRGEKPAPLTNFTPSVAIRTLWHERVGAARDYLFTPAVVRDAIYAAGYDGRIVRVDAATGRALWRVDTGRKLSGGVGADENLVVVGTAKGEVLAYDPSGRPLWEAQVTSEVLAAPGAADGIVVVRTGDGRIFGLDAKDGKRKWVYQRAMPSLSLRSHAGVTIARGAVFAGFAGGKLVALNLANGNVGWEATVAQPRGATELERIADITSLPAVDGDQVCAVAYQGRVACFDIATGNNLWARELSSVSGLAMDERYLYVSDAGGAVHALDRARGASVWKQDKLLARHTGAPLPLGRYIAVADVEGYVHLLSRDDGSFAARAATDGSWIAAQPVLLNRGFLVQTRNGGLYALALD